jgi:hypothetical protein
MIQSASEAEISRSGTRLWLYAFGFMAILLVTLCIFFELRWATNDDVAMAMIADGYGLSTTGTPHLVFSNVVWGYLVRLVPEINGTSGYSVATVAVLFGVGVALTGGLLRLGLGYAGALLTAALILTRPILLPQFTINAGLLMLAAVMCWHLYAQHGERRALWIGCAFAFCSYLVRSLEFVLMLAVALPLLPWRALLERRTARYAAGALAAAIVLSAVIDHRAYRGPEWTTFKELNAARAAYTDFRADERLKQRGDILERHHYSTNDVDLIGNWFFVDQKLADPAKLNAMLDDLGPLPEGTFVVRQAWAGMEIFWRSILTPIFLTALLLAALRPTWKTAAVWGLCIAAMFAMSVAGRPGVVRVCMPLAFLLLISPFLSTPPEMDPRHARWRDRVCVAIILVATIFSLQAVFTSSRKMQEASENRRIGMAEFPTTPVVVWGGTFPFQAIYPVLGRPPQARQYQLYGLGVMTWAPHTVSFSEHQGGRGLTSLLVQDGGVPIVGQAKHFVYLEGYCKEHLRGKLNVISVQQLNGPSLTTVRCEVDTPETG